MKGNLRHKQWYAAFGLASLIAALPLLQVPAQSPFVTPTTPHAQRNALGAVRSQVNWVENATRTASSYGAQGYGGVWQNFQGLRQTYSQLKATMNPQQLASGANQLAELDAGLDIIQEAFANYQSDVAQGRPVSPALREMCRVVRDGTGLWLQELNKTSTRLQVGWGG